MKRFKIDGLGLRVLHFLAVILFLCPIKAWPADTPSSAAGGAANAPGGTQPGTGLSLEEVVRIALENHSSVKSAEYQIGAQDAVLHQQMAQYYPSVNFNNSYRTSSSAGGTNAFDTVSSAAIVTMTLYNFGKREGSVQSARDTLDATRYGYNTTANNIVLSVKQAYYGVLQANALLRVNEETVKDRDAVVRQTRGFYDVGTRPKSDVTQAEANLYLAQANLITAQNNVDTAWASLRNAMGVDDFPKQPLGEDLSVTPFSITLDAAQQAALAARPELSQFKSLLKAQDDLIAVARRNHLPDILFSSSYGRQNDNQDGKLFPLQPNWQVQLNLIIPIFNGFQTTNQVQQALYTYRSIKEQERVQRQQVALQVEQNYLNLTSTREAAKANEAAVKAAKENLDLHEGRYQVGYASIVEVTTAQATYTGAQTSYVNALIAYKLAVAQLLNAIGAR